MRRNRVLIVLLVIVTVLAMATTALAGIPDKPDKPGKPPPPPEIWTCAERVENGAVWLPGRWEGDSYVSDVLEPTERVDVDVPLCIDMAGHKTVESWLVEWEGKAERRAPKGLMFIFEEELPGTHYAEAEAVPDPEAEEVSLGCIVDEKGDYTCTGSWANTTWEGTPEAKHLVFLAMGHRGDKWTELTFTVTPDP